MRLTDSNERFPLEEAIVKKDSEGDITMWEWHDSEGTRYIVFND